jgi:hypothetical protein
VDEHGPEVHGMVFSSQKLNRRWAWLDDFEGEGYERVLAPIRLVAGGRYVAYVYALRGVADAVDASPSG